MQQPEIRLTVVLPGSKQGFKERGSHELKGVPGTWTLYAVSTNK